MYLNIIVMRNNLNIYKFSRKMPITDLFYFEVKNS